VKGVAFVHVHSMRLRSGGEALVARVTTNEGRAGYGFSFRLDAAEARHMAAWNAGALERRPECAPALDHPWERAWMAGAEIAWNAEPGFTAMRWLP
jgi:hypothetical protein